MVEGGLTKKFDVRIDAGQIRRMDRIIEEYRDELRWENRSHFLRAALQHFLRYHEDILFEKKTAVNKP